MELMIWIDVLNKTEKQKYAVVGSHYQDWKTLGQETMMQIFTLIRTQEFRHGVLVDFFSLSVTEVI